MRVTGAVRNPISIPYRQGMTVLDAVLAAGGTTEFAAPDRTRLFRKERTEAPPHRMRCIWKRSCKKGDLANNYPVQPGDVITVPQRSF